MDRSKQFHKKLSLMTDYCSSMSVRGVPDPYYGGPEGFEHVLDILEDACDGLLKKLRQ
jgi:protein-tyrosine phosphatase